MESVPFQNQSDDNEFEDEDFMSDNDDCDGWDDLELIQNDHQLILNQSGSQSVDPKLNECWQCSSCQTINNVNLCIRKYNSKCYGCKNVYFIKSHTETMMRSEWDTANDYLLRMNKIWKCKICQHLNENMNDKICIQCKTSNDKEQHSMSTLSWKCINCNCIEDKSMRKCSVCNCVKPIIRSFAGIACIKSTVHGFCRIYFDENVPQVIKNLVMEYFSAQTFSVYRRRDGYITDIKPKLHQKRHYNQGYCDLLIGDDEYVSGIITWKLKLEIDPQSEMKQI